MAPMVANSGLAFQPAAQQPNPMQQNPNLQALPGVNPTAPRFEFNRPSVQTGFYDPTNRLNLFLQTLQQARNNPALPAQQYVTPPITPVQALGVNTPMPQQLGAGAAPPPAAAPAAGNNLFNNLQKFITVGGKRLINPLPGAYMSGYNLSYKERK